MFCRESRALRSALTLALLAIPLPLLEAEPPTRPKAPEQLPLWPGRAPVGDNKFEAANACLTIYPASKANGAAMVICPGGGYRGLVVGAEGHGIAQWLNRQGIAGVVLEYRLPKGRPFVPLLDAQRAIRTVRFNAKQWRINPNRFGIIGFSAGGHLAATAGTHFDGGDPKAADPVDRVSCRPDFAILIYPVISMEKQTHGGSRTNLLGQDPKSELVALFSNEKQVTDKTPPMFLAHAKDDTVVSPENSRMMYDALKAHNVAAEFLELPGGNHGLNGYKGPMWDAWQAKSLAWLAAQRIVPASSPSPDDQYKKLTPDSEEQPGVSKGKLERFTWDRSKVFPGTTREVTVYVPAQYDPARPAAVFVCQDGVLYKAPTVFDNLIARKEMPATIGIFIQPGDFPLKPGEKPRKRPDGRQLRADSSKEYDTLSDDYARFLLEEILPEVGKKYNLSKDPEGRCIAGSSSGGICAFTVCWQRPDEFRKCFTTVGSFTNIRGGDKYPELVRNSPKKPIRVFQQDGANDLVNQFGSWPEANKAMAKALDEKGYDHKFVFGEGVHSHNHGTHIFPEVMRWMWRDYPK